VKQKQSNKNVLQLIKRMSSSDLVVKDKKQVLNSNSISDISSKIRMPKQFKVQPVPLAIKKIVSHLMMENGESYKVVITPPSLEYFIDSQNCRFVKYLTSTHVKKFTTRIFADWEQISFRILDETPNF